MPLLLLPAILHWNSNHFVVLEQITAQHLLIVDPASGRQRLTQAAFAQQFSGVALLCTPTAGFEPLAPATIPWRSYARQLWRVPGMSQRALRILGLSLLIQALGLAAPFATQFLVDRVLGLQLNNLLGIAALGIAALVLSSMVLEFGRTRLLIALRARLDRWLMQRFLQHLLALAYPFFQTRNVGDLLMRVGSNLEIRELLSVQLIASLLDLSLMLVYFTILVTINPLFALLVLALALLQLLVLLGTRQQMQNLNQQVLEAHAQTESYLNQVLHGVHMIKATSAEPSILRGWSRLFERELGSTIRRSHTTNLISVLSLGLQIGAPLVLLWFGIRLVLSQQITLGTTLALTTIAAMVLTPLSSLTQYLQRLITVRAYIDRLQDVLDEPPEQTGAYLVPCPTLSGQLAFEAVSFRYSANGPLVLCDVSFTVAPGEKIAIVGKTGAGKSTLIKLLLGLYQPSAGRISYDGYDLQTLPFGELRRQIGTVLQDAFVFTGTIRDNIAHHQPETEQAAVEAAAQQAALDAEISAMPLGYQTDVGELGANLSGGQRQRLALARALLEQPRLLLLDEATSHLDRATELQIQRTLDDLACTQVIIAHRLSSIRHVDRVLVLEQSQAQMFAASEYFAALADVEAETL